MIVAAFALDRLNDNGADVDPPLVDEVPDLALGFLFARNYVSFALRFRQRKIDVRTRNAGPIEFCEQIRLARVGIREAHRVAASPVKRTAEMQNLRAALPFPAAMFFRTFQSIAAFRQFSTAGAPPSMKK